MAAHVGGVPKGWPSSEAWWFPLSGQPVLLLSVILITLDIGEAVFEYFVGEPSPGGMTDVQPLSAPQRLGDTCQGLTGSMRTLFHY